MSKLLVSDYDGTFFVNNEDLMKNIEAVDTFRKAGNLFVFATGNNYHVFSKVVEMEKVGYDYLILDHGSLIIDRNINIINCHYISEQVVENIVSDLADNGLKVKLCNLWDDDVKSNCNITKISTWIKDFERAKEITLHIKERFGNFVNAYTMIFDDMNIVEIISGEIDKNRAIKVLANKLGIRHDDIYTVGNGYNDIEMITEYNGYCMEKSVEELLTVCPNKVQSVSELIEMFS